LQKSNESAARRDLREQIERAVWLGNGNARHLRQRSHTEIAVLLQPDQHFSQRVLAPQQSRFSGALRKARSVRDDEFVELRGSRRQVAPRDQQPKRHPVMQ